MDTEEKQLVSQEPAAKMLTDAKDESVYLFLFFYQLSNIFKMSD